MKTKKIAGVSVNLDSLPSRKDLIKSALQGAKYRNIPNPLEMVEKDIDKSGLFRVVPKKTEEGDK